MSTDPRIDAYIAKAAPFAQPILVHLRALVHATVDGLDETLKWGIPHFMYKGKNLPGSPRSRPTPLSFSTVKGVRAKGWAAMARSPRARSCRPIQT